MHRLIRTRFCVLFLLSFLLAPSGCQPPASPSKYVAPKPVEKPHVESDLTRTTLADDEVKSLRVRSEPVRSAEVQERLPFTGWVMVKQGNEVTVTAPLAGFVADPGKGGALPVAGLPVKKGQELFQLEPVLSPVEQIQMAALKRDMEKDLTKAQEMVTVSTLELQRVEKLFKQKIRQEQDVEQARAKLRSAEADLEGAKDKLRLFGGEAGQGGTHLKPVAVRSPRGGIALTVLVSPGQFVQAAAPLVMVADLSELWVRVPVPENDLPKLDPKRAATVLPRSNGHAKDAAGQPVRLEAEPVAFVPLVDPAKHTADLIYRLDAGKTTMPWAKDQMVDVLVPLGDKRKESVVPYTAVVYDSYGGSWVYLDRSKQGDNKHVFERRRVEVGATVDGGVVIGSAAQEGDRVVVEGVGVLFSREFHRPPTRALK
jgi:RND family efflux transporter MFP subunit